MMVETTDGFVRKQNGPTDGKVLNMVYPEPKESLLKFLERCHNNNSQVGLCPRCDVVFNVDAAHKVRFDPRRGKNRQFMYTGENRGRRAGEYRKMFEKPRTFRPKTDVPEEKWVRPINFRGNIQNGKYRAMEPMLKVLGRI